MASEIIASAGHYRSTNEKAWWAAEAVGDGPYSPLPGEMSIRFCGGNVALQRDHKVDVSGLIAGDYGKIFTANDEAGHTWYCRWIGTPFWSAFRDRTDAEVLRFIEGCESRRVNMTPSYALRMCKRLALEISLMSCAMRPENSLSRGKRRAMKRRLAEVGDLMESLLQHRDTLPVRQADERMLALGIYWKPLDPSAWLDANH